MLMRLDKFFGETGAAPRKEVKSLVRAGRILVNGRIPEGAASHINPEEDEISLDGHSVAYSEFEYYILNKPAGYVCAASDKLHPVVLELIDSDRKGLSPVGRLDIDTEGLLLITNDGKLSHEMLSPKKHVAKTYFAEISGIVTEDDAIRMREGLDIGDEKPTLPASLEILSVDETSLSSEIRLTITEGRYHQVKRMFEALGKRVTYLKRISFGSLVLPEDLRLGESRRIDRPS